MIWPGVFLREELQEQADLSETDGPETEISPPRANSRLFHRNVRFFAWSINGRFAEKAGLRLSFAGSNR